jgi:hypothetical protein
MAKARETYTAISGGKPPPEGMSRDYCRCLTDAMQTGDAFTKSVEFCRSNVYRRYGLLMP